MVIFLLSVELFRISLAINADNDAALGHTHFLQGGAALMFEALR